MSDDNRRRLMLGVHPQQALADLIHAGLAAGKVEGTPLDRAALAVDMAREATGPHFRQRWRLPKAGRCQCGCGEKIAANKQFKFGHDKKEISADSLIPKSEVPNAGAE